jgi:hypothetical protein
VASFCCWHYNRLPAIIAKLEGKTLALERLWARHIIEIVSEFEGDPARFRSMRSNGEFQRARTLKAVFPPSSTLPDIVNRLQNRTLFEHVSLLLRAHPDLLNITAEALPFLGPNPAADNEPAYIPQLRQRLQVAEVPVNSALEFDPFFRLLFSINKIGDWGSVISGHMETFEQVFHQELDQIAVSRRHRAVAGPRFNQAGTANARAESAYLIGLAFSGGGIRSATVCLGVLQALADLGILAWFDYLSTVSGGGYIGAWVNSWIKRLRLPEVREQLSPRDAALPSDQAQDPIRFLRRYSNYLTPQIGFFSADTWTLVAIWLRNVALNLGVLIPGLVVVALAPRLLERLFLLAAADGIWILLTTFTLFLSATIWIGMNLRFFDCGPGGGAIRPARTSGPNTQGEIQLLIVIPLAISSWTAAAYFVFVSSAPVRPIGDVPAAIFTGLFTFVLVSALAWLAGRRGTIIVVVVALAAAWGGVYLVSVLPLEQLLKSGGFWASTASGSAIAGIAFFVLAWMAGYPWCYLNEKGTYKVIGTWPWMIPAFMMLILICTVCGFCTGALQFVAGQVIEHWAGRDHESFFAAMAWGPLLLGLATTINVVLFLGLTGRAFPDDRREWWSRVGAWLAIYGIGWGAWMLFSFYGPFVVEWAAYKLPFWLSGTITAGWIVTTVGGLLAAKSQQTASPAAPNPLSKLEPLARFAPYVFIVGLLLAVSWGAHRLVAWQTCDSIISSGSRDMVFVPEPKPHSMPGNTLLLEWEDAGGKRLSQIWLATPPFQARPVPPAPRACLAVAEDQSPSYKTYWELVNFTNIHWEWTLADVLLAAIAVLLLAWKVDINEFSMHHFYRNRLIRCYMGASGGAGRKANPFTGLDFGDDLPLASFRPREHEYEGPYPIVNTAINLSQSENLAFQERKASSFVFTPLYCGFQPNDPLTGRDDPAAPGYRPTERFAYRITGPHAGTAMAISGAAASPNWGYHTSPAMAFLMTVFDIRLGWWIGNPLSTKWRKSGPPLNLGYLLCELVGLTSDRRKYVYLSDGGHFDNMGLYELVRRRCRFIVLVDAEEDIHLSFEGLGMAIRKCRIDFAAEIDLNVERIRKCTDRRSQSHCVIGDVWYPPLEEGGESTRGTIVYLKSSLTGDEETDILEYAEKNVRFPHQSTADQFFDESQFESYRKLGLHIGFAAFGRAVQSGTNLDDRVRFIVGLRQKWYAPSSAIAKSFALRAAGLDLLWERLRTDNTLTFLSQQLYPEWRKMVARAPGGDPGAADLSWLPQNPNEIRSSFFFCMELIQLMESVYLDLNLEADYDHPDNRGWMNLFRHWSHSGMFRVTWAAVACTYGVRFQNFCLQKLAMELGAVVISKRPLLSGEEPTYLNPFERNMIARFRAEAMPHAKVYVYALGLSAVPQAGAANDRPFLLPFGFALVRRHQLVGYRVQDHLRQMGLGRLGLAKLTKPRTLVQDGVVRRLPPIVKGEALVGADKLTDIVREPDLAPRIAWEKRTLHIALDEVLIQ